jgi:hypothetical protein
MRLNGNRLTAIAGKSPDNLGRQRPFPLSLVISLAPEISPALEVVEDLLLLGADGGRECLDGAVDLNSCRAQRTELADHRLLVLLEPVTAQLWDLFRAGYQANWFCYIASRAVEHAAELDRQTMQRLLALPGDPWLDDCGDGFDCEDERDAPPS